MMVDRFDGANGRDSLNPFSGGAKSIVTEGLPH